MASGHTLSNNRMKNCYLFFILCFLLTGCSDKLEPPVDPTPQPRAEAERTVIVYMAADNTLTSSVRGDTTEMVKGKNMVPENVNFIIFLDDKQQKPAIYEMSAKGGMKLWKQYEEELCTTDSLTMLEVLREIEHYFPARHYGITFWSHATGWTPEQKSSRQKTFGKDETVPSGKTEMEIPVLHDVLAHLPKFEYIFFDACFMQSIEVAYELRDVTNYMVGSPSEIPGPGAPYDKVIEALSQGDAMGIVRGYDSGYPATYNGFLYPGVLLSCIDCTRLEPFAEITGRLLTPYYMNRLEPTSNGFQYYCNISIDRFTYCFDMRTTMRRLLSDEDYMTWMTAFNEAIPLHSHSSTDKWYANYCTYPIILDPDCFGGVSMFVPMEKYDRNGYSWNADFQKTSWYKAAGWEQTGW